MQEYCPECAKNGVKSRIKAFQLNLEEAIFMCSSEKCIWPAGCQDLTYISRPVGKDWSKNWDEAAAKHIKKESETYLELSPYTPPQTPGTELGSKEISVTSSAIHSSSATVPNKVFNSKPVNVDSFEQDGFDDLDLILNCSFDNDIINIENDISFDNIETCKILKPKLDISKTVNCKLKQVSSQDSVFIDQCDTTVVLKNTDQRVKCKNETVTNKTTSLVYKFEDKNVKPNILKLSPIKQKSNLEKSRLGSRLLKRKGNNLCKFEKFNFDDCFKQKFKKVKQEEIKKEPIKVETCIPKQIRIKNEIKIEKGNENSHKNIKILKVENSSFDFDLDKMLSESSTNVNRIKNNVELPVYTEKVTKFSDKDQIDFDNILGLTSSSKDSGVDQDLIDNGIDMDLEELLAGFSDDLTSSMSYNTQNHNTHKTSIEETDENKWINSLFE